MKNLLKLFITGAIVFTICVLVAPISAINISVADITGVPGEQVVVPVYLSGNDTALSALTIPLQYNSTDIIIDSVNYTGTLLKTNMSAATHIDNSTQYVRITYLPSISEIPLIRNESGLLARIWVTISPTAIDQVVLIDSINTVTDIGGVEQWIRIEMTDSIALTLLFPSFTPGSVDIRTPLDADDDQFGLPDVLSLKQNYPNPFNPSTTIKYSLPERSHVDLRIFNILGQEVETLVDNTKPAGEYEITWQAGNVASGIYFYRLSYQDRVLTKKMTLLK